MIGHRVPASAHPTPARRRRARPYPGHRRVSHPATSAWPCRGRRPERRSGRKRHRIPRPVVGSVLHGTHRHVL